MHSLAVISLTIMLPLALNGCTKEQLVKETVSTIQMSWRQDQERKSFFGRSTAMFYPNGAPTNMDELPKLSSLQVDEIQKDLDLQTKILLDALNAEKTTIKESLKQEVHSINDQAFKLETSGFPTAMIDDQGEITIDVRVIQSIYRGILVSSLNGGADSAPLTNDQQRLGLQYVIAVRESFLQASPIPTIDILRNVLTVHDGDGNLLDEASQFIDDRLALWAAITESEKASDSYDDAIAFIIAHELGHRAMSHYYRLQAGERQYDLELEADRFGALLVVLARNYSIKPNDGYRIRPMNVAVYSYMGGPWCLADINYQPYGHKSFFNYGYQLAGFDSLGRVTAQTHPPREARVAESDRVSNQSFNAIDTAQNFAGSCLLDSNERADIKKDPMKAFLKLRDNYQESLEHTNEQLRAGSSDPEYLRRRQWYGDLLADPHLQGIVFLNSYRKLIGRK